MIGNPLDERQREFTRGFQSASAMKDNEIAQLTRERDELRKALQELHDEATRIGEFLGRKGQGATALGVKCLKARKALATLDVEEKM